jgi:hypothetical protein
LKADEIFRGIKPRGIRFQPVPKTNLGGSSGELMDDRTMMIISTLKGRQRQGDGCALLGDNDDYTIIANRTHE